MLLGVRGVLANWNFIFVLTFPAWLACIQPTKNESGVQRRYSGDTRRSSRFAAPSIAALIHRLDKHSVAGGFRRSRLRRERSPQPKSNPRKASPHATSAIDGSAPQWMGRRS